jgi:hypothetical protein
MRFATLASSTAAVLIASACSSEEPHSGAAPGVLNNSVVVTPQAANECDFSVDCPPVPAAYTACAEVKCRAGKCMYLTLDKDGDGHRTNQACGAATSVSDAGTDSGSSFVSDSGIDAAPARALVIELGDDCDDANVDLFPGHATACGQTAAGTAIPAVGECKLGLKSCLPDGKVSACAGAVPPKVEDCNTDSKDEDCDGSNVNGCNCVGTQTKPCGSAVGKCKAGVVTCAGGQFGACVGAVTPAPRNCASVDDNNCDGAPDSAIDATCQCAPGTTQACNMHVGRDGRGICRAGTQACVNNGTSSFWGACSGDVAPAADSCAPTGPDSDCDGVNGNGAGCAYAFSCDIQFDWYRGNGCTAPVKLLAYQAGYYPVTECSDGLTPATIYLSASVCYIGFPRRTAGYVSPTSGGAGWTPFLGGYTQL